MTISESDSLWLRHLSGQPLQPWEEERLLSLLEDNPDLKDAALQDRELDGLLRMLDRTRGPQDHFLRDFRSAVADDKDRTRFMSRFRERMKRETGTLRLARANTTRRIARVAAPPTSGARMALIAAELLGGVVLLLAALSSGSEPAKPAPPPQVRRPAVEEPAAAPALPTEAAAPRRPIDAAPPVTPEPPAIPELRPAPAAKPPAPADPPRPAPGGRHDTMTALAVLDRVVGDVFVSTPKGLRPAKAGQDLLPGLGIVTVGSRSRASVKYSDSTLFHVPGDTIIRELAEGPGKRVVISQGRLSIQVARQPAEAPLEIVTPAACITVLGTRFSVACDADSTRVLVDEGRVRLTPVLAGNAVELGPGDCAGVTGSRIWSSPRLRSWAPPPDWKGSKAESAQGNPLRVDGKPAWRLDQIWPDDPLKVENYTPLVWSGVRWYTSDHLPGGQPSAESSETSLSLGVRTWWPDQLGSKLCSLAFVAPADGLYVIEGSVRAEISEGGSGQPLLLQIMKMDRKEKRVAPIASLSLSEPRLLELQDLVLPLKAQQEILFVPQLPEKAHVASRYIFEGLRISRLK